MPVRRGYVRLGNVSTGTSRRYRRLATLMFGASLLAACGASVPGSPAARDIAPSGAGAPGMAARGASVPGVASGGTHSSGSATGSTAGGASGGAPVGLTSSVVLSPVKLPPLHLTAAQRRGANPPPGLGFTYAAPGWVTSVTGRASGITARVVVWLPPEYALPAYAHTTFPVVQLLGGYPANVFGWMHGLDVVSAYYRAHAAGIRPTVLVATEINVEGNVDLECLDAPGHPRVETWITRDVPAFMRAHFRVARPGGWGLMGFSMGGFCAPYLALTHPDVYRAAVAINGYLAASSPQLPAAFLAQHSVLLAARSHPAVSILWTTTHHDPTSPISWAAQLKRAVAPPTRVTAEVVPGDGHATKQWSPFIGSHLVWLVPRLPSS